MNKREQAIATIREALEASKNGLEWYAEHAPEHASEADAEHMDLITTALSKLSALSEPGGEAPTSYAMSRDYDKLYQHLCNGGEVLGKVMEAGLSGEPEAFPAIIYERAGKYLAFEFGERWIQKSINDRAEFLSECQRLSLEWLAPVSAKRIMEVVLGGSTHENETEPKWKVVNPSDLRSRLSSELGLK